MNIPPVKRQGKIEKIHQASKKLAMQKFISPSMKLNGLYPIGGYSIKELNSMLDNQLDYMLMDIDEYQEYYLDQKIKKHPFNQLNAFADFEWWGKKPYWTLDEAIALLFNKNPEVVHWETVKTTDEQIISFVKEYKNIKKQQKS